MGFCNFTIQPKECPWEGGSGGPKNWGREVGGWGVGRWAGGQGWVGGWEGSGWVAGGTAASELGKLGRAITSHSALRSRVRTL